MTADIERDQFTGCWKFGLREVFFQRSNCLRYSYLKQSAIPQALQSNIIASYDGLKQETVLPPQDPLALLKLDFQSGIHTILRDAGAELPLIGHTKHSIFLKLEIQSGRNQCRVAANACAIDDKSIRSGKTCL